MKVDKEGTYHIISLLCAVWFLTTGWLWTYYTCLFIAYPIGLLGLYFWSTAKKINPASLFNKIVLGILIAGLAVSIGSIFIYK